MNMADHAHNETSPCEEALAELYTFLDGELTDAKRSAISSHLEACNPCVEIFDFEAELRIVVSTKAVEQVPDALPPARQRDALGHGRRRRFRRRMASPAF